MPDSGSHLVPAGFGPELPDFGPTGSEFVSPKNTLMWTKKGTIQKLKILSMLFICRALLSIGYWVKLHWFESELVELQSVGILNCKHASHATHICSTSALF